MNSLCIMTLIAQISKSELTLVFILTRTLDLNFVSIVGIRVTPLVYVLNIKKNNSQFNRGAHIMSCQVILT